MITVTSRLADPEVPDAAITPVVDGVPVAAINKHARIPAPRWMAVHELSVRQAQQSIIDAEIRASRRAIVSRFRHDLRTDARTLATESFLAVADRDVLLEAIIVAARGVGDADACDLQTYDPRTGQLQIAYQRGFSQSFLDYFATVDTDVPSACGTALATGDPVLINDIRTSHIFAGQPTLAPMLAAGTRAVQSYPLRNDHGDVLGMLSLHYRSAGRHPGQELLAWSTARALANLSPNGSCNGNGAHPHPATAAAATL